MPSFIHCASVNSSRQGVYMSYYNINNIMWCDIATETTIISVLTDIVYHAKVAVLAFGQVKYHA